MFKKRINNIVNSEATEQLLPSISSFADHIPGGFFIYKAYDNLELIHANKALMNIFACNSLDEFKKLTGFTFKGLVHPDDYARIQNSISSQIENSKNENHDSVEYRIIRKDGLVRWVDDYGYLTELPTYGKVFFVFLVDTTDKHNAREELRKKANIYSKIINQYNELADNSLSVLRLNHTQGVIEQARGKDLYETDYVGAPIKPARENRLKSLIGDSAKEEYRKLFNIDNLLERYYNGEGPVTFIGYCRRKEDSRPSFVKFTSNAVIDPFTNEIIVFKVETEYNTQQISEIITQKILLKQFDYVIYIVGDSYGVILSDVDSEKNKGNISPKNRDGNYSDFIKNQVLPFAKEKDNQINIEEALSLKKISDTLNNQENYSLTINFEKENQIFTERFIYYLVNKETQTFLLLKTDITELLKKERERNEILSNALKEAENANVAKTSFLSNMSHDIRTPLNAILGYDTLALTNPDISDLTKEQLMNIGKSAKHLLNLINDILDMSRIEAGRININNEDFSFKTMLDQIITLIHSQCLDKNINFDCQLIGTVKDNYIGDVLKIKQILINILSNAVKYTKEKGTVTFIVKNVREYKDNSTLEFIIQDTGVGIDKDYLPKLFEPFSQGSNSYGNKYGSTGLGLAITKSMVELMNGKISVSSEKGIGSTFKVSLTLNNSKLHSNIRNLDTSLLKVLVIDDEQVDCDHAKLVLQELGIYAETCLDGKEALKLIEINMAKQEPYNLILLDWKMPKKDGLEVAKSIRSIYKNDSTAIIFLTAYNWEEIVDKTGDLKIDGYITKPLFSSNIIEEFDKAIINHMSNNKVDEKVIKLEGRNILLAEDMPINAEIIKQILELRKIKVDIAENGKIALDKFSNSKIGFYDAILMDVRMPILNGLEATKAIRSLDREDSKSIPIIALTANAFDDDVKISMQAGMNAHLSKPIEIDQLYKTLIKFLKLRMEKE